MLNNCSTIGKKRRNKPNATSGPASNGGKTMYAASPTKSPGASNKEYLFNAFWVSLIDGGGATAQVAQRPTWCSIPQVRHFCILRFCPLKPQMWWLCVSYFLFLQHSPLRRSLKRTGGNRKQKLRFAWVRLPLQNCDYANRRFTVKRRIIRAHDPPGDQNRPSCFAMRRKGAYSSSFTLTNCVAPSSFRTASSSPCFRARRAAANFSRSATGTSRRAT
jgi:hypothetical protein